MANGQESERFKATKIKAEQGDAEAQYFLGWMYYKGQGVPQNYEEAAKWTRKAAEQGRAWAQYNLGVPQDYVEAAKWYRKAAEQGDAEAQHNLGVMYYNGEGVPQDFIESYAWVLLAKADGDKESLRELRELISSIEEDLTAEQRKKGQARAAELHRLYGKNPKPSVDAK